MFSRLLLLVVILIIGSSAPSFSNPDIEQRIKEFRLKNGMRVIALRRGTSPTFAAYIRFLAGGTDERTGTFGVAHILEHMLFKGSERVGTTDFKKEKALLDKVEKIGMEYDAEKRKGNNADPVKLASLKDSLKKALEEEQKFVVSDEISEIYQRNGSQGFNAFTSQDTTTYLIKLPANRFELWAWLESDRLRSPILREYYAERDVIMEERRRSIDNSAEGTLYENFVSTAFRAHPYGNPIIGWESDIDHMPLEEVKRFLKTYYSPNNMVVCVVGDLDPEYVFRTVERYFGDVPPQDIPPRTVTKEPAQKGERRVEVEFDANPEVMMGFHKPTFPSKEDYVFDVINYVLSSGRTSRFYKSLVLEKQLAVSVGTWIGPGNRYDNLFMINATPRAPHTTREAEEAIYAELDRLKTEPLTKEEFEKVINNVEAGFIRSLQSNSGIAHYLSDYAITTGDWRHMMRYTDEIRKVTPEDVMAVAGKYLVKSNRTVATLVPLKKPEKATP